MWQWLLVLWSPWWSLLIIPVSPGFCEILPSSVGPTSPEEAALIWKEGKTAFEQKKFKEAIFPLQRLIDRYPGASGYLQAHYLLARAFLVLHRPAESLEPLKYYIQAVNQDLEAKIWLGRAYLELKKYHEADLISLEVEKARSRVKTADFNRIQALLIRTQALIGMGKDAYAENVLASAKAMLPGVASPGLPMAEGEALWLGLELKTVACRKLPSKERLAEGQLKNQLERRGLCLLEAMVLFHDVLEKFIAIKEKTRAKIAEKEMVVAFKEFDIACSHPAEPPPESLNEVIPAESSAGGLEKANKDIIKRTSRTPLELKRYKAELAAFLREMCLKKFDEALRLTHNWIEEDKKHSSELIGELKYYTKN